MNYTRSPEGVLFGTWNEDTLELIMSPHDWDDTSSGEVSPPSTFITS